MHGEVFDYPTRVLVHSESVGDDSYLVDLVAHERYKLPDGTPIFNGSCLCKHFKLTLEPLMRRPENEGKVFRCKHIRWARENVLDYVLPVMKSHDPNIDEEHQT